MNRATDDEVITLLVELMLERPGHRIDRAEARHVLSTRLRPKQTLKRREFYDLLWDYGFVGMSRRDARQRVIGVWLELPDGVDEVTDIRRALRSHAREKRAERASRPRADGTT